MIELKPCPFCGEVGEYLEVDEDRYGGWFVTCGECGASIGNPDEKEWAEESWNKRHNGWIKCSDRMPTDVLDMQDFKQIKVLVSTKNNLVKTCLYRWIRDYNGNYTDWEFSVHEVIAWQPLPEPYKEDGE